MGQITTWMEEYQRGDIDQEALVANLVGFEFKTPARFAEMPADIFEAEDQAEERTYEDEDTMDEVYAGTDRGLITEDDLLAIATAREAAADA